jgi:ribosome biogenesis ATPase
VCLVLQGGFDFAAIARKTPGFVGADLAALTKEAAAVAVSRIFTNIDTAAHAAAQQQQQLLPPPAAVQDAPAAAEPSSSQAAATPVADSAQQQQQQQPDAGAIVPAAAAAVAVGRARMGAGPLTVTELAGLAISMSDFEAALPKVQPSVRREGFTTKPDATWEDVGSLEEVSLL